MEKSIEKSSKQFLENSGLKVYNFLEKSGYGKLINLATFYDMKDGEFLGKIFFEFSITNCHNIENIIDQIEDIITADFSTMKHLDYCNISHYTPTGSEGHSYLFIFERYLR